MGHWEHVSFNSSQTNNNDPISTFHLTTLCCGSVEAIHKHNLLKAQISQTKKEQYLKIIKYNRVSNDLLKNKTQTEDSH